MEKATRWLAIILCMALLVCVPTCAETVASCPPDGLYTIGVDSNASMFRVVNCVLQVEDGVMMATLTMSGSGYGYLYPGTGKEADATPVEEWIPYREDTEGRHVFTLPVSALDTEIAVASYSIKYSKWYDRTLVFRSGTMRAYTNIAEDGIYRGVLASDTSLNGESCVLTVQDGCMSLEFEAGDIQSITLGGAQGQLGDDVCRVPLSSLDLRAPVMVQRNGETQEGWLKLSSSTLSMQRVRAENGTYSAQVTTDSALLRFSDCKLSIDDSGMTAVLTATQNKFDYIYLGAAENARSDESGWIAAQPNADGAYTYELKIASLDSNIPLAVYSSQQKMWQDRTLRIEAASLVRLEETKGERDAEAAETDDAVEAETYEGESGEPDTFSFSGGSGRVTITCSDVRVDEQGRARATIVFSSPNYTYVRVGNQQYECVCDAETSRVDIPVKLNRSFEVYGTTTAMSSVHEVEYTLYIGLNDVEAEAAAELSGLVWESALPVEYAEGFSVDYYAGGYALIDITDGARYLVVPEGKTIPDGLDPQIIILQQPLDRIYLVATSAMALFDALDALDAIRLTGTDANDWYIENARSAIERGEILFAGKYNEPDFELLLTEGCDLAIESTMISHSPKIQEMIELLGIPVFIDRSSYETHPLGRTEWIKLYGVLLGREKEAIEFFDRQAKVMDDLEEFENTEKTVAFFYINSNGSVVVRSSTDYISRMIELAGGRYAFDDLNDATSNRSSITISMEQFYNTAVNTDYLIYNATITDMPENIEDLLAQDALFADFKAVKEGNVWCTDKYLYQATDVIGNLIVDIHKMLTAENGEMMFLHKLS